MLPRALGFALGPIASAQRVRQPLHHESGVRSGATAQAATAAALDLGAEIAAWGEPTGVAIEPDGSGFVIGQRREDDGGDGVRERLVAVQLACTQTALAPREIAAP